MLNTHKKTIGFRIKVRRQLKNLSQEQLAAKVNCGRSTISKIETGKQEVEGSMLFAIAEALDTTADEFNPKQNLHIDLLSPPHHPIDTESKLRQSHLYLD